MATKRKALLETFALQGARARLREIDEEIKAIFASFPQLRNDRKGPSTTNARGRGSSGRPGPNKGRKFSVQVRARMSDGMRRYWARRKAQAKA